MSIVNSIDRRTATSGAPIASVLLVDDHPANLLALESILAPLDLQLVRASSGEDALKHLLRQPFALILLDVQMPGMDGFETAAAIKAHSRTADIPIIFITAINREATHVHEGYGKGAVDYLLKPFDPDILRAKVSIFVELYRKAEVIKEQARLLRQQDMELADRRLEKVEAEHSQHLRDQQFYTRSLFESNIDALITIDPRGIIADVNKQMEVLTGCTRDELIGGLFKNYFTEPERAESAIQQVLSKKRVTDYELTACARNGKRTEVSCNATTLYDRQRALQGVFVAARDVTERRCNALALQEANAALESAKSAAEKANLAKSDFLSSMSQELRSQVDAILGFAQLMESGSPLPTDSQKESLGRILQAGRHLVQSIDDILDGGAIESGKVSTSPESVLLAEVMNRPPDSAGPAR